MPPRANRARALLIAAAAGAAGCATVAPPSAGAVRRERGPVARLEEPIPVRTAPGEQVPEPASGDAVRTTVFPGGPLLYDPYMAAQRQSRTSVKVQYPAGGGGHRKVEATLGLQRSLLRWTREGEPASGTELQFEGAVFARFDLKEHYDFESSDWRFGLPLVFREGDVAWKIHLSHTTSHLGDEYIERTGEESARYHLEEAAAGISWDAGPGTRLYGEAGAALYAHRPAASGRLQGGFEWVGSREPSGLSPWFATDLQVRNEQDWTPGITVASGVSWGRSFRFGIEYFRGKDPQTQFLDERTSFLSVGLTFDY